MSMKRPKLDETKIQIRYDFQACSRSILNASSEFDALQNRLNELQQKYNKGIDEIHNLFMEASCDVDRLEAFLEGKLQSDLHMWTILEDFALNKDKDSPEYQHLLKVKGQDEINKRLEFLNMFA